MPRRKQSNPVKNPTSYTQFVSDIVKQAEDVIDQESGQIVSESNHSNDSPPPSLLQSLEKENQDPEGENGSGCPPESSRKRKKQSSSSSQPQQPTKKSKAGGDHLSEYHKTYLHFTLPALVESAEAYEENVSKKPVSTYDIQTLHRKYSDVFNGQSNRKPCYLLPVMFFLGKTKLIVSQFNLFQNKLHVLTNEASSLVDRIIKHSPDLSDKEKQCLISRFKRTSWYKIPLQDEPFIRKAAEKGHLGKVEIHLKNVKETYMHDPITYEKTPLLMPEFRYYPVPVPTPKKASSSSSSKKQSSKNNSDDNDSGGESGGEGECSTNPLAEGEEEEENSSSSSPLTLAQQPQEDSLLDEE